LKTYTRSLGYLETLKAGSARIDLEGNPVGTVTEADEEDAKRKIAKAARRAAAKPPSADSKTSDSVRSLKGSSAEPNRDQAARFRGTFFLRARITTPKRKRSPATIYGGLRLAGTLVLLHRYHHGFCQFR
jgi:sRNA-binding protein